MIFVTVGAQMPFDRLVHAVDGWAEQRQRRDVFAQVGSTTCPPTSIDWEPFLEPDAFERRFQEASAIVGHAGTGTILLAMQHQKPILVLPRRAGLRETRNDHQVATCRRFEKIAGVAVAWDETEIPTRLDRLSELHPAARLAPSASEALIGELRGFFEGP